jgi:hypothetical protein
VDKELISTLNTTNSTLTGQLAAKNRIITTLQAQLRNSNNDQAPVPAPHQVSASDKKKCYCWTHGIRFSRNHNSANCHDPGDGHKSEPRINDIIGGDASQGGQKGDNKFKFNLANNLTYYPNPVARNKISILYSGCTSQY